MEKQTLFEFVRKLCLYFERKIPNDETLEQWFETIGHVPAEPLNWIADQIKGGENWPKNLPGAIHRYWYEWLDANPERRMKEREMGCSGCVGGYVQVSKYFEDVGAYYNVNFRCAVCKPRYPQSMTMATPGILALQGYCKPIGYLTSWKYADGLPDVPNDRKAKPIQRGPINGIVGKIVDEFDLPF